MGIHPNVDTEEEQNKKLAFKKASPLIFDKLSI